ncbi:copper resistance protein C [Novosphingobium sediminis]|uniref:Copper resistance protein C n=1 Tax=Novosphingobium sediminis TaxID=707214 RepID=A0A512AQR5_9SPHN|nr:copper homeostasis periplasmic binding protein CopC [Novosphingobium sediminis]GEO02043.1 copper resistance protein C [Novosphingobium sediminis]
MKFTSLLAAVAIAASAVTYPAAALAHTKVVASTPAEGATVASARTVTLSFSEALLPPTAAASLVMTAMPGMKDHGEMAIRNFTTAWSNGNKTMTLTLAKPLAKGTYEVRWQAAGADGHRMKGTLTFTIG